MQENHSAHHLVIGGVGGKGVLLAGRLLAEAAMNKYEHVLWFPNYAASMRGGDCECSVVLSEQRVAAPVSLKPSGAIIMDQAARKKFEERVQPGGMLMLDSSVMPEKSARSDLQVYYVPATKVATELGSLMVVNLVLLGAFLEATKLVPVDWIKGELERRLRGGRREDLLNTNLEALQAGVKYATAVQSGV